MLLSFDFYDVYKRGVEGGACTSPPNLPGHHVICNQKDVLSTSTLNSQLENNLFFIFNFLISANRKVKFERPKTTCKSVS